MKPTKIRRDIQSRHARSTGDVPRIGRVTRVRDADGPTKSLRWTRQGSRRHGGASSQGAARRHAVKLWSVVLVVFTTALLGVFVSYWLKTRGAIPLAEAPEIRPGTERVVSKFPSPSENEALSLVKNALEVRDPALVETHFRMGGADAAEIIGFLGKSAERDGKLERTDWLGSMDTADLLIEGVLLSYQGSKQPVERIAFLVPDEKGVWKVDFDGFARASRPSWQDLLAARAERAQVRVFLARDSYFNGPFHDESQWQCFAMVSPETKEIFPEDETLLRGYCKVGSPQAGALTQMFVGENLSSRATLEIRRVEGANHRQFEITRVLAAEWVIAPRAFDERFD